MEYYDLWKNLNAFLMYPMFHLLHDGKAPPKTAKIAIYIYIYLHIYIYISASPLKEI